MKESLGPIEICCDAPPYETVRACRSLGLRSPEDVRWCRLSSFLPEIGARDKTPLMGVARMMWQARGRGATCRCGEVLPHMRAVDVTYGSGREVTYVLGQCRRCHTVFWEET
jgi:hypothetical protein